MVLDELPQAFLHVGERFEPAWIGIFDPELGVAIVVGRTQPAIHRGAHVTFAEFLVAAGLVGDVRRRHDDHHRIFEAIIGREPWRAEMLMRDHVASVKSSLVARSRRLLRSTQRCGLFNVSGEVVD